MGRERGYRDGNLDLSLGNWEAVSASHGRGRFSGKEDGHVKFALFGDIREEVSQVRPNSEYSLGTQHVPGTTLDALGRVRERNKDRSSLS